MLISVALYDLCVLIQVVVELVLSFVISLVGVLITAGEVLPIRSNKALHARFVLYTLYTHNGYVIGF